jgi:hypothetical protein
MMDNNMVDVVETTTFRNDARNDWVDAVFGIDFFPCATRGPGREDAHHRAYTTTPPAPIPTSGSDPRTTTPRGGVTVETTGMDGMDVDATLRSRRRRGGRDGE